MNIHLIAATNRQPDWVVAAIQEYARRFHGPYSLHMTDVRLVRRSAQTNIEKAKNDEAERLLAAVPAGAYVIALDERGKARSSRQLAEQLVQWQANAQPLAFLLGGPDGLGAACLAAAREQVSLSTLTLPHALAKIVVLEALYRATTIVTGHPYHRD